jgi:hypothetical protein
LAAAFIAEVERIEAFISEVPGLYLEERDRIPVPARIDLRRDPQMIARLVGRL